MLNLEDKSRAEFHPDSNLRLADVIFADAVDKNPDYKNKEEEVKRLINTALREIAELEAVANPRTALELLTPEVANKITAIWVVSGSGNYEKPKYDDLWVDIPWADWSDRNRIMYGVRLAKKCLNSEIRNLGMEQQNELCKIFLKPEHVLKISGRR